MNRFFSVLNFRNLWAVDFPLFTLLAMEALSPGIIIHTASHPTHFLIGAVDLSLLWLARVVLLTFQKKAFAVFFESGWPAVLISSIFLLPNIIWHHGPLALGAFLPLAFLFTSAYAVIYRPGDPQIYWRLVPMAATVLGFVLSYLRPEAINPIPVSACLLGGASHWFISKYKTSDPLVTSLRVYFITVVALLTARLIYSN
ncbi:MAG: hypothetical protein CK519_00020 [Opitutia bacterium]|nr:hypothetical protein [Opitutales bacterium]PHX69299.1 MAG: hypothetical protein CK519_00020 [Opitutae bacterium]